MRRMVTLSISALSLVAVACQPAPETTGPDLQQDLSAISEAREALVGALRADDVPGIMAQLTDDHLTMPPGQATPPNNEALEAWHQDRIDAFAFQSEFSTDDIQVHGDIAIERWSGMTALVPRDGGDEIRDEGKGIWIWERQADGSWKLLWSAWNSSLAPQ